MKLIHFITIILYICTIIFHRVQSKCPPNFIEDTNGDCTGWSSGIKNIYLSSCYFNNSQTISFILQEPIIKEKFAWNPQQPYTNPLVKNVHFCKSMKVNDYNGTSFDLAYEISMLDNEIAYAICTHKNGVNYTAIRSFSDAVPEDFQFKSLCGNNTIRLQGIKKNIKNTNLETCFYNYVCTNPVSSYQQYFFADCSSKDAEIGGYLATCVANKGHITYTQKIELGMIIRQSGSCSNICVNGLCNSETLSCSCYNGYTGINCDRQALKVACDDENLCPMENSQCFEGTDNNTCACNRGFISITNATQCLDINECSLGTSSCDLKSTICENTPGSFNCKCLDGFTKLNSNQCIDKNECEDPTICSKKDNFECKNTQGSYTCQCLPGYFLNGTTCIDKDACSIEGSSCPIDSKCVILDDNHFYCKCSIQDYILLNNKCIPFPTIENIRTAKSKGELKMDIYINQSIVEDINEIRIDTIPCKEIIQFGDPSLGFLSLSCKFEPGNHVNWTKVVVTINHSSKEFVPTILPAFIESITSAPTTGGDVVLSVITEMDLKDENISLSIGDFNCRGSMIVSSNSIICRVPTGTGIKKVLLNVNNASSTDSILFSYMPPLISHMTKNIDSSLGGWVEIQGSNFGTRPNAIHVYFDLNRKVICDSVANLTNHNSFSCFLPPSNHFKVPVVILVDGVLTKDPFYYYYSSATKVECLNDGINYLGVCQCKQGFNGPKCNISDEDLLFNQGKASFNSNEDPRINFLVENDTMIDTRFGNIGEYSEKELIIEYDLQSMPWEVEMKTESTFSKYIFSSILPNNATVFINILRFNSNFDLQVDSTDQSSQTSLKMKNGSGKMEITIQNWPFSSRLSHLEIEYITDIDKDCVIPSISYAIQNYENQSLVEYDFHYLDQDSPLDNENYQLLWIQYHSGYYTFYTKFINTGILDGEETPVKFLKPTIDETANLVEITGILYVPYFKNSAKIDPEYTLYTSSDPMGNNSLCVDKKGLEKWVFISSITIIIILGIFTIASFSWYLYKRNQPEKVEPFSNLLNSEETTISIQ
ncbi:hypothetical protein CYY_006751 [Polysphondylium violaceum]|uniref:EGF-like domain-containing protein n=1 Tax=Polysphondylium violaceum TaxID=133409 RepID=A0A8J4PZ33_9MYCE|nr:hypothetical protein CYY_006751 [Polysphondylium violaceum]